MPKTTVKIYRVEEERSQFAFFTSLLGVFFLGVSLSSLYTLYGLNFPIPFDTRGQLGAVGDSQIDTRPDKALETNVATPSEGASVNSNDTPPPSTDKDSSIVTSNQTTREAELRASDERRRLSIILAKITDMDNAMSVLNREIERVKNDSVVIVTEFNQSCGLWSEPCALTYSTRLEKNNAAYASLSEELRAKTYERDSLILERDRIVNARGE